MYAPVLISVYHRLYTLKRCVAALQANADAQQTDLFVVSDGPYKPEHEAKIAAVREFVKTIKGFRSVNMIARPENWGANRSINTAIDELNDRYGCLIFMEDDIVTSKFFLRYMNEGLERYWNDERVFAICANKAFFKIPRDYKYDVHTLPRYCPWGVGYWGHKTRKMNRGEYNRYEEFKEDNHDLFDWYDNHDPRFMAILKGDSDGKIRAADVRIEYNLIRSGAVCIYPNRTLTNSMDSGSDSMHTSLQCIRQEPLSETPVIFPEIMPLDYRADIYDRMLASKYPSKATRLWNSLVSYGFASTMKYYGRRAYEKISGKTLPRLKLGNE